jgi:hypothetical protein
MILGLQNIPKMPSNGTTIAQCRFSLRFLCQNCLHYDFISVQIDTLQAPLSLPRLSGIPILQFHIIWQIDICFSPASKFKTQSRQPHQVMNQIEFDPLRRLTDEFDNLFGADRLRGADPIKYDMSDSPYIDAWCRQGRKQPNFKYSCFIRPGILLSANWLKLGRQTFDIIESRSVVAIEQRIDFDLDARLFTQPSFQQATLLVEIDAMVQQSNLPDHSPYCVGTFLFRIDRLSFEPEMIPPFLM